MRCYLTSQENDTSLAKANSALDNKSNNQHEVQVVDCQTCGWHEKTCLVENLQNSERAQNKILRWSPTPLQMVRTCRQQMPMVANFSGLRSFSIQADCLALGNLRRALKSGHCTGMVPHTAFSNDSVPPSWSSLSEARSPL